MLARFQARERSLVEVTREIACREETQPVAEIPWLWIRYELVAVPATLFWSIGLHWALGSYATNCDKRADRILWIPALVGLFERAVIVLLIGWQVPGAASFIGAWVIGKSGGGWAGWGHKSKYDRGLFFIGLLGSALSILFGIGLGLAIHSFRHAAGVL